MPKIPSDPYMLLSFVNMHLRDDYDSLDELASAYMVEKEQIILTLSRAGFTYDESSGRFK